MEMMCDMKWFIISPFSLSAAESSILLCVVLKALPIFSVNQVERNHVLGVLVKTGVQHVDHLFGIVSILSGGHSGSHDASTSASSS